MKKRLNRSLAFVLVVAIFVLMSGCTSSTPTTVPTGATTANGTTANATTANATTTVDKPITLTFAHNYTEDSAMGGTLTKLMPDFMVANPKITIINNAAPGETLKTKMQVEVASGTISDLVGFWAAPSILAPMTDAKALIDIQTYFAASSKVKASSYDMDSLKVVASQDGKNYLIPYTTSKTFIVYNKALFAKYSLQPPKTFEELKTVAAVFNQNGIIPFATGSNQSLTGHFLLSQIACQYPGGIEDSMNIGKTNKIDTPAFNTAAKYLEEMRLAGVYPKDTMAAGAAGWNGVLDSFGTGKAAMAQFATWMLTKTMLSYDVVQKDLGIMDFPKFPGATVDPHSLLIGQVQDGLCFSAKSWADPAKQAAMIKFGDALLSDEAYILIAERAGSISKTTVDVSKVNIDPIFKALYAFTKDMSLQPQTKSLMRNGAQVTAFQNEFDKLFTGADTGSQFIQNVQKAMNANP